MRVNDLIICSAIARHEQRLVAISHFVCGTIKGKDIASGIGERPHAAAGASAGGLRRREGFALESFPFVGGAGHEYGPAAFTIGVAGLRRMPGDIDLALRVRGDRASAVETVRIGDYVALGFKGGAGVV